VPDLRSSARRRLLKGLGLAVPLAALGAGPCARCAAAAAPLLDPAGPLLDPAAPEARAVKYVEDAAGASGAAPGSTCANCALYQGGDGSKQGPCQIFPGKEVRAAGWCASWAPQM
jgi:hypothetical protein